MCVYGLRCCMGASMYVYKPAHHTIAIRLYAPIGEFVRWVAVSYNHVKSNGTLAAVCVVARAVACSHHTPIPLSTHQPAVCCARLNERLIGILILI
jgi:hypothetical protein